MFWGLVFSVQIAMRTGLGKTGLIDNLCHELAHLVSGYAAGHDESWEKRRDELSVKYWARSIPA